MEAGALYRVTGGGGWGFKVCLILNSDGTDVFLLLLFFAQFDMFYIKELCVD